MRTILAIFTCGTIGCMPDEQGTDTGLFSKTQTVMVPVATKRLECRHTNTPIDLNVHVFVRYEDKAEEESSSAPLSKSKRDTTKKKFPRETIAQKIEDDVICVGCDDDEDDKPQQSEPLDIEIELNPITGDYNVIIKDFQLDLGE